MSEQQKLIPFTPTNSSNRHDGWTAERQIAFIEALAETACVEEAARRVGMTPGSAYRLRRRPCGMAFKHAWDAALDYAVHRVEQAVLSRALNGVARPVFYKGEQVGEWRHHDERLAMFLLRTRRPARYGKWTDRLLAPDPEDGGEHSAIMLEGGLEEICDRAPVEDGNLIDEWNS